MTKQDSATAQHTSKPQGSGKTDSDALVPDWHQGPKPLTKLESLRRRYKKFFGFKPCGISEKELERIVLSKEADHELHSVPRSTLVPESRATIGDALKMKR